MKLSKIALGVSLGLGGMAAQASDVLFFPYVVHSSTVTTLVDVIDNGGAAVQRYNSAGVVGTGTAFNRLHWRLNYKSDSDATDNSALCHEVDYYLPTSPQDLQSVDLSGHLGSTTKGVLFNDPSINNNWSSGIGSLTYSLASNTGSVSRGVLFVHNADNSSAANTSLAGTAMIFEFANGAAWGYAANFRENQSTGTNGQQAADFNFSGSSSTVGSGIPFMPLAEVTTKLFVTPLNDVAGGTGVLNNNGTTGTTPKSMLAAGGASIAGWDRLTAAVSLVTGSGVAYDRDENLVSGTVTQPVTCVGAVTVADSSTTSNGLLTSGAATVLADGGYGLLNIAQPSPAASIATTPAAAVLYLAYSTGTTLNGESINGVFNNGYMVP